MGVLTAELVPIASAAAPVEPKLVRIVPTSAWTTPSSDPTGLTYQRSTGKLLITDAEIEEIGRLWSGSNLFVTNRRGSLIRTRSVRRVTDEPEDIAWRNRRTSYVVDDDRRRVYRVRTGPDGLIGTRDDRRKEVLRTRRFGSRDPEGLAWRGRDRSLILTDAKRGRVFRIGSGRDRRFGTLDDTVRPFSSAAVGVGTPEDVVWDPRTNHLLIVGSSEPIVVETTMRGRPVRTFDLSASGIRRASGIALAPDPARPGARLMFVTDKGVDNETDPGENDGRLFVFRFPG
ncbi:MAG TPA: SdiA-regulated domain-containing protein [Actinomycetota bacterium]|nr:SdiA-regulated domain-containing protein [Actinomycetota bacterium]